MPVVDLILLFGAGALVLGLAGLLGSRADKKHKEPDPDPVESLGIENAERLKQEKERRCAECDRAIDPNVDAFDRERWWCRACWVKLHGS